MENKWDQKTQFLFLEPAGNADFMQTCYSQVSSQETCIVIIPPATLPITSILEVTSSLSLLSQLFNVEKNTFFFFLISIHQRLKQLLGLVSAWDNGGDFFRYLKEKSQHLLADFLRCQVTFITVNNKVGKVWLKSAIGLNTITNQFVSYCLAFFFSPAIKYLVVSSGLSPGL